METLREDGKRNGMDWRKLSSFEGMKDKLELRLINRERNRKRLDYMPHIQVLDTELVVYAVLDRNERETVGFYVMDIHLQIWQASREQLFRMAGENMRGREITMRSMPEILFGMGIPEQERDGFWMYVLSNQTMSYGAIEMLRPGVLRQFAERMETDLVILPSSVHEVLLVPLCETWDFRELGSLVREINQEMVAENDILGEQAYIYRRDTDRIELTELGAEPRNGETVCMVQNWWQCFLLENSKEEAAV